MRCLNNLAGLYTDMGRFQDAERLLHRCIERFEATLGKDDMQVATALNSLGRIQTMQERWGEAVRNFDRVRHIIRRRQAEVLPNLAPADQLAFIDDTDGKRLEFAMSLGWLGRSDADVCRLSYGWHLNSKAVYQEAQSQYAILERDASDPRRGEIVRGLQSVRRRRSTLTLTVPKPGREAERQRLLDDLIEKQHLLERQLTQAGGTHGYHRGDPWVDVATVRKAIPRDAVLIDIRRVEIFKYSHRGEQDEALGYRYVAWIVLPIGEGDVQFVDLGDADALDSQVQAIRNALTGAVDNVAGNGEPNAEKALVNNLGRLAQKILLPLQPQIDGRRQWLLSPDGTLWLVPWAALPVAGGRYAIEKHVVRYLVSGRDLVTGFPDVANQGPPLIVADPDFDLRPQITRSETRILARDRGARREGDISSDQLPQRVPSLPGTAAEAIAIKPLLERFAGEKADVYTGTQALERVVKSCRSPKVLVLSTHGFFLTYRPPPKGSPATIQDQLSSQTALLRCGLLFAGYNCRDRVKEGDDDGILTGAEIVGIDLRGTELVVLSACDTGSSQMSIGGALLGLRQAFQLAGAQAVVATLWQIPDTDSARLMNDFFANLAAGQSKGEALRNAQLKRIESRRDRFGAAHPYFWAAFTLTGR